MVHVPDDRPRSWRESPMIRAALRERPPEEVSVVYCDRCGSAAYYNNGSHCACEHCGADLGHLLDPDTAEVLTMADVFEAEAEAEAEDPGGP